MRDLIEAKKRKIVIRLVSHDSSGDFTFQVGNAFYSGTVDPAVLDRIVSRAKRAPGKALAMAKEMTTLTKNESMEDDMRDLLDKMKGAELVMAEGREPNMDVMYKDFRKILKDLKEALKLMDKHQTKALEKSEPDISNALYETSKLLNSAYRKFRGVAAAVVVVGGK